MHAWLNSCQQHIKERSDHHTSTCIESKSDQQFSPLLHDYIRMELFDSYSALEQYGSNCESRLDFSRTRGSCILSQVNPAIRIVHQEILIQHDIQIQSAGY